MGSVLDDVDVILANGDLEVFKRWVEDEFKAQLESKNRQVKYLLNRIQELEYKIDVLEHKIDRKLDIERFEYETTIRYEN